jgi:transcriptional antiterminator NusG
MSKKKKEKNKKTPKKDKKEVKKKHEDKGVDERGTGKKKIPGHIIINKEDSEKASWYVVHTTSGHEARVAETLRQRVETMHLEEKIHELLVPTQDRVVIRGGKKSTVKEKIFPGYLLVKMVMDDPTWLAVRTTPGITGFVGAGKTPTPLSEGEVNNIQKFISTPAKRFKTKFSTGEAVKITDGPFSDFLGTIDEIDQEKGKVKVLVSIFGRETPVELDLLQISKV